MDESGTEGKYATRPWFRWGMPWCIGMVMFANHYSRDAVGALEKQLESYMLSPHQYAILNSLYFFPNIIAPLIGGMLIEKLGGASLCYLYSVILAALGHIFFAIGVQMKSIYLLFFGRFTSGCMYEIVDALMPIVYLSPFFQCEWGTVIATMNVLLRTGSVVNFLASPLVYEYYGVQGSIWLSCAVGSSAILFMVLSMAFEHSWLSLESEAKVVVNSERSVDRSSVESLEDDEFLELQQEDSNAEESKVGNFTSVSIPTAELTKDESQISSFSRTCTSLFPISFYCYLMTGALIYGSMVPFWFAGSKFLQDEYLLSVKTADFLMVFPEGMIIIVCFPLGAVVDRFKWGLKSKLAMIAVGTFLMATGYFLLVFFAIGHGSESTIGTEGPEIIHSSHANDRSLSMPSISLLDRSSWYEKGIDGFIGKDRITSLPGLVSLFSNFPALPAQFLPSLFGPLLIPALSVSLLGLGYACATPLFWGTIPHVTTPENLSFASGIVSAGVNLLPSIMPPILVNTLGPNNGKGALIVLAVLALCSSCFSILGIVADSYTSSSCCCCKGSSCFELYCRCDRGCSDRGGAPSAPLSRTDLGVGVGMGGSQRVGSRGASSSDGKGEYELVPYL